MKKNKFYTIALFFVFILAFFLRFYKLSSQPASLYWEEAALGYDAYSILKTGKDFHGHKLPLAAFESFGDWKPSLYFYTLVPFIALFGLSEFSVRFPSAFFGSLTVMLIYFLVKELLSINSEGKNKDPLTVHKYLPLIATLLLAISPWHLQFSRAAFEANLAVFLIILTVFLFFKAINSKPYFLIFSSLSFSLSLYAYHAARVFTPVFVIALGLIFIKKLKRNRKIVFVSFVLALICLLPLIREFKKNPLFSRRFQETSAFSTLEPILESNKKIEEDGSTRWAKIIHHRFWYYGQIFFKHYFDHFRLDFLFLNGDNNPRHSTGETGVLYLIELPFLIGGLFFLFYKKEWLLLPILFWLLLAPIPAGFTKATPHALRFLISIPSLQILTAYGMVNLFFLVKKRIKCVPLIIIPLFTGYAFFFLQYLHFYYQHYSYLNSQDWQYGYKQMMSYVLENQDKYDAVYITRAQGRPSIYYFFYGKIDPNKVQGQEKLVAKDQGEFLEFDKVKFGSFVPNSKNLAKTLVVASSSEVERLENKPAILRTIHFLDGQVAFVIYEI